MCRHLGYLGPAAPVGEILTRGTHSLRTQSWAPRDMRGGGTVNADGFGVAWWPPGGGASRYRNAAPIWSDPAVDEVLPQLSSTAVLAAVRSATVGMPVERSACAPFVDGRWAFSHNGVIPHWRTVLPEVAKRFGAPDLLHAESGTDSAALWVILHAALTDHDRDRDGFRGGEPREVLGDLVRTVLDYAPDARVNLLLSDGETLWATAVYHALSVLVTDDIAVIASEPYDDDPRWNSIADRQLVLARPGRLGIEPLDIEPLNVEPLEPARVPDESERART
ncbi:MAG: ergothioneine biosynthesis protein EgtC [Nocardia sp.]|nr:ergothioneine biosynthesis protein EgtC [Nocardia sp.]